MRFLNGHIRLYAAVAAVILGMVSCSEKDSGPVLLEIAFKTPSVTSEQGQVFISVNASSDWTLAVTDGDWGELRTTSGQGTSNSVILDYQDNPSQDGRTLTVEAKSGKKTATAVLTQNGYSIGHFDTTTSGSVSTAASQTWMELPATSTSDRFDFLFHMMTLNGRQMRNYSLYWDYDNLVARWVAYPLNKEYIGTGKRSDAWGLDPLLEKTRQPVLYGGFKEGNNGWYARGHQLPSADRYSGDSNVQTFYGTNMTPQDNGFNGGIWANLEKKVRSWAENSDTLYVVTGCVLDGAKYYCYDNENKKVTVPTGYFKAILRYSPSSTITQTSGGYMGCAFFFEHKNYTSMALKPFVMSIDELERITEMDFFVNLPAAIGADKAAAVEAADPSRNTWWGL